MPSKKCTWCNKQNIIISQTEIKQLKGSVVLCAKCYSDIYNRLSQKNKPSPFSDIFKGFGNG